MKAFLRFVCVIALASTATSFAQVTSATPGVTPAANIPHLPRDPFPLWANGAPGALGTQPKDIPTLTPFFAPPKYATGAAMIVMPGGAYGVLAPSEGVYYALWLNEQGIAAFVLKYRLGPDGYHYPAMLQDAQRAIRYVRSKAADWKINPARVGVIGSSAGGHLASTCLTHFDAGQADAPDPIDRMSSRPDLGVLCYPVITMGPNTHAGSKKNLLGDNPDPKLVELLSNENQVTKETPPTFIFHTVADATVKVENSLEFAAALQRNGVPFELHLYMSGTHGISLGGHQWWDPEHRHPWTTECARWLTEMGFGRLVSQ